MGLTSFPRPRTEQAMWLSAKYSGDNLAPVALGLEPSHFQRHEVRI